MSDDRIRHERLLARIERGERIEAGDEMSATYRDCLVHLMTMQADSELAGAYGYVPWIMKAPGVEEKLVVAQIVKDETRHAKVMYDLLEELGEDVAARVETHDQSFARRLDDSEADIGTARVATDKRVNIFYYPIDTWADFVMFNFCMDRGAGHQLEDVRHSSYGPWRRGVEGIFKEERMHIRHGELWIRRLAENPATRDDAVIVAQSFSKSYCMTGWRIGWIVSRADLAARATQLNEFIISHAPSFGQRAAETALRDGEGFIAEMLAGYRANRDYCMEVLRSLKGVTVPEPSGAFYLFPQIDGLTDSFGFCKRLLLETKVGLAPGVQRPVEGPPLLVLRGPADPAGATDRAVAATVVPDDPAGQDLGARLRSRAAPLLGLVAGVVLDLRQLLGTCGEGHHEQGGEDGSESTENGHADPHRQSRSSTESSALVDVFRAGPRTQLRGLAKQRLLGDHL